MPFTGEEFGYPTHCLYIHDMNELSNKIRQAIEVEIMDLAITDDAVEEFTEKIHREVMSIIAKSNVSAPDLK